MKIGQLFTRTAGVRTKEQVQLRVNELASNLRRTPVWLTGVGRGFMFGMSSGAKFSDLPPEFTKGARGPFSDFSVEKRKSSAVEKLNMVIFPEEETGIEPFQLFVKTKERVPIKQLWEFLMLDLWSALLRSYTATCQICLTAPQSYNFLGSNALSMAFEQGTIGTHLAVDYNRRDIVRFGQERELPLYQAFAFHLGALARVKEAEELSHGDYQLRHVLFDAGGRLRPEFYITRTIKSWQHRPFSVDPFLTRTHLSVVDVEHGLRSPQPAVQAENEKMLLEAKRKAQGNGARGDYFEAAYRDGYDSIAPQGLVQSLVDDQYGRLGVSVDNLF